VPSIPGIPDDLQALPGVQALPPGDDVLPATLGVINDALNAANLAEHEHGKLVWILNKQGDREAVNIAIVNKFGKHFEVVGWIGKTWGAPVSAGVGGSIKW